MYVDEYMEGRGELDLVVCSSLKGVHKASHLAKAQTPPSLLATAWTGLAEALVPQPAPVKCNRAGPGTQTPKGPIL